MDVGKYTDLILVARGGNGAVYSARSPEGLTVALKLLNAGARGTERERSRFQREVKTLLRIRHPGVVALLDAGERQDGAPYLVMEWIEGETLETKLDRDGPLAPLAAAELVRRLAEALAHCHAQGVLHRDLKPANVLLRGWGGEPLLTDFGLSKDLELSESTTAYGLTRPGASLGTPGYWPPEQARGELGEIGPRSDVYGLGAVLYAALTGHPPHECESVIEALAALDIPIVPPRRHQPAIPAWLEATCLKALATRPDHRQAGPAELAADLARGLSRGGVGLAALLVAGAAVLASTCLVVGGLAVVARARQRKASVGTPAAVAEPASRDTDPPTVGAAVVTSAAPVEARPPVPVEAPPPAVGTGPPPPPPPPPPPAERPAPRRGVPGW